MSMTREQQADAASKRRTDFGNIVRSRLQIPLGHAEKIL